MTSVTARSSWSLEFQNECDYMFRINTRSPLNEGLQRHPFGRLGIKMDSSLLNCADSPPGKKENELSTFLDFARLIVGSRKYESQGLSGVS